MPSTWAYELTTLLLGCDWNSSDLSIFRADHKPHQSVRQFPQASQARCNTVNYCCWTTLLPSPAWTEFVIVFALLLFSLLQILLGMPAGVLQTLKTFFKMLKGN